jgi:iron complex outermembrane recepter protein
VKPRGGPRPTARTSAARRAGPGLVALGLVLGAHGALAQQPDTTHQRSDSGPSAEALKKLSFEQLLNVQVMSVSKRPERLLQAPAAIQVITTEDIRRSGATSLPEALRLASNLQVAQIDSRQWAISARGFLSTAGNKLLVLIDGRTVYTPLYSGVFWDVQDVPLSDVDRIEVISGPGATLWGANAVNGVINIITKSAKDTQGLLVSGGGGSELHGFGTARYGGTLGTSVRYRLYGTGFGYGPTDLPSGQRAVNDWHLEQGGFRTDWDASALDKLTLQADLYDGRISEPAAPDVAVSGHNVVSRWSHTLAQTSSITTEFYYDHTHRIIPNLFGEDLDVYDLDFQHHVGLGARNDVVWGGGFRLMNDTVMNSPGLAFLPPHVTRRWYTGFVQDEIALVPDRLHLDLGTKVEHNDYTGVEWQPSARVNWTLGSSEAVWAAASRALRTPSRIDRELYAPAQPPYLLAGGPNFHSEEELAYELGFRHQSGPLAFAISSFYSRYYGLRSIEQVNPPAPTPLVIGNGQDGESYGAELTSDYRLSERWGLHAGYTELRVHIWPRPGSTDRSHGSAESAAPDRQFFLRSSIELPARLSLDAGLRAVSGIAVQQVPAYAELDARLSCQAGANLSLALVGQNLLHDRHAEFEAPTARQEIPRSVYASLEWHP